jgi:PadR family transcriptional regulator PadR
VRPIPNELLHGTLDVLILKALAESPRHGYEIARHVSASTGGAVTIEDGSLYPALYRLEKKRQIKGVWGVSEAGRRARFYSLTAGGRKALAARTDAWTKFAAGVSRLLLGEER